MSELVAARAVEYWPDVQRSEHTAGKPEEEEYEPAAHETQVAPVMAPRAVEYRPEAQRYGQGYCRPIVGE